MDFAYGSRAYSGPIKSIQTCLYLETAQGTEKMWPLKTDGLLTQVHYNALCCCGRGGGGGVYYVTTYLNMQCQCKMWMCFTKKILLMFQW